MKITANLGLKKPEGTDVVNIDDFNYNADVIDTELQKRALKTDIPTIPVQSVNGKTGTVTLTAGDVGAATSSQGIKADTALQRSQLGQTGGPAKQDDLVSHLADDVNHVPYAIATGSANSYAVTLIPAPTSYIDGMAICVKINVASTGASTLNVNGLGAKTILDSLGNAITSGGLKAGVPYTLRYNGTNFIVQGKGGGGNATSSDLLNGKIATVDTGQIVGTMPNRTFSANTNNYTNAVNAKGDSGGGLCVVPQTGYYIQETNASGFGPIYVNDPNFIPANLVSGKTYFGVVGTATIQSLGGRRFASGTGQVYADGTFTYSGGSYTGSKFSFTTSSIPFTPRILTVYVTVTLKDSVGGTPGVLNNGWFKDPLCYPNGLKNNCNMAMDNSVMNLTANGFYWQSAVTLNVDAINQSRYYFTNNVVTWYAWE